jgi:LacI family transcriptional regulator
VAEEGWTSPATGGAAVIPDDVAVVGYDNWETLAADCRPPLTTIDLNLEQLGAIAVEHLSAALDGHRTTGVIRHPGRLVVRESTGPPSLRPSPAPARG